MRRREYFGLAGYGVFAGVAGCLGSDEELGRTVYVGSGVGDESASALLAIDAETGAERWRFEESTDVVTSPIVVAGTVFVGSLDGSLYAVDAGSGELEWEFDEPGDSVGIPTVVDNHVFATSLDNSVYAVEADTGRRSWRYTDYKTNFLSTPSVGADRLYTSGGRVAPSAEDDTDTAGLHAIDIQTGTRQWIYTDRPTLQSPTFTTEHVFIHSDAIVAVARSTGDPVWDVRIIAGNISAPLVVGERVYVCTHDGRLVAVDRETASIDWEFETMNVFQIAGTASYERIFVGGGDGRLYAVDMTTGDGVWQADLAVDALQTVPTVYDEIVYVGSDDGHVYAFDTTSGKEVWHYDPEAGGIRGSPTVVETPATGHSVGSRALLGVEGHHDGWTGEIPPADFAPETTSPPSG